MSIRKTVTIPVVLLSAAVGLSTMTLPALAKQDSTTTATSSTATKLDHRSEAFIKQAARDNNMEVSMAEMGASKAQNQDLKSFCQKLQQDHTQANQQLQSIAQKYNITVEQPNTQTHELNRFQHETAGPDFDKKLATDFLRDHQKDIAKFEKASNDVQAPDVKQYIDSMIPKLREHFQQAETVARTVGVDDSTIASIVKKTPEAAGGTGTAQEPVPGTGSGEKTQKGEGAKQLQQDQTPPSPHP